MLSHYSALKVAESFRVLETLFPGRIDLGIGRAPGSDQRTARALRHGPGAVGLHEFPQQVMDVIADFPAYPEWAQGIHVAEVRETFPDGRAKDVYFELSEGPIKDSYVLTYTWNGNESVDWTLTQGKMLKKLDGTYALVPRGGTTEVTYTLAVEVSIPMMVDWHGAVNALGFALCGLLGWHVAVPLTPPAPLSHEGRGGSRPCQRPTPAPAT